MRAFRVTLEKVATNPRTPDSATFSALTPSSTPSRLEEDPHPEESYDCYRVWLRLTHRNRTFYAAVARDLGYKLSLRA